MIMRMRALAVLLVLAPCCAALAVQGAVRPTTSRRFSPVALACLSEEAPVLAPVWQRCGCSCKIAFMPAVVAKSGPLGRVRPEPAWERKERSLCTLSAHLKVLNMWQMHKQRKQHERILGMYPYT